MGKRYFGRYCLFAHVSATTTAAATAAATTTTTTTTTTGITTASTVTTFTTGQEKKQWRKGRAIISCYHSFAGNLFRVITSRALDTTLQHLYPQHPGQLSIPQLWRHLHQYIANLPPDITQPLVCLFNFNVRLSLPAF